MMGAGREGGREGGVAAGGDGNASDDGAPLGCGATVMSTCITSTHSSMGGGDDTVTVTAAGASGVAAGSGSATATGCDSTTACVSGRAAACTTAVCASGSAAEASGTTAATGVGSTVACGSCSAAACSSGSAGAGGSAVGCSGGGGATFPSGVASGAGAGRETGAWERGERTCPGDRGISCNNDCPNDTDIEMDLGDLGAGPAKSGPRMAPVTADNTPPLRGEELKPPADAPTPAKGEERPGLGPPAFALLGPCE